MGEPIDGIEGLEPREVGSRVGALLGHLTAASLAAGRFARHPMPDKARATAGAATAQAVSDLIEGARQGAARHLARQSSIETLDQLEPWFHDGWCIKQASAIGADGPAQRDVAEIAAALPTLEAYQRFRARATHVPDAAIAVFGKLRGVERALRDIPERALDAEVRRIVAREARLAWKQRLEAERPELHFDADELADKAEALEKADEQMRELNRRLLVEGLDASQLRPRREWDSVTRLQGQRAHRLREFIAAGTDLGLMRLRPVWLMNPDVASRMLPLSRSLFDAIIYDEASQMPVEYALPTLFRASRMIVSGDEKQMPPTSFFSSKVENDEAEQFEGHDEDVEDEEEREAIAETWNRREIKDCPDLLQLAKTVLPSTTLQIHYRSAYRELIQFSNAAFYDNRLNVPVRHPRAEIERARPVHMVRVDGVYESQTNRIEAERAVDEVIKIWQLPGPRKSLGVVTFNRKQADLIDEVLERRAERDPSFRATLAQERERVDGGEDMGFFVKNVENVQGDERDVIVFSSTFGRNAQGTFRRTFGVLGQAGGERRLNVAVTRAREKVVLVTSMPIHLISDMIGTQRQASSPRDYLQGYFEYARALSDGEHDTAAAMLTRLAPSRPQSFAAHDGGDGFRAAVVREIEALGWTPVPADDGSAFGLDFAIENPDTGLYALGIECDAPRHPILATARAREIWRPSVLERSIPTVHRVSSHGWFHRPEEEKALLIETIETALGTPT